MARPDSDRAGFRLARERNTSNHAMPPVQLPAPCHLCGQTCVSRRRGRVVRRLDRTDLGVPAPRTDADTCPWRQCPHRPHGHRIPPVIEDQTSHAVVAFDAARFGDDPDVVSLHPDRGAAQADRDRLAATTRGVRHDLVVFPHAVLAAELDAAQEPGHEADHGHARETTRERLREEAELAPDGDLLAGTVRALFPIDHDLARAIAASVRLGYDLDAPLWAALGAAARARSVAAD